MPDFLEVLANDESTSSWLTHLQGQPDPDDVRLPSRDDLAPILLDLAVPHEDLDGLVATLPTPDRSADLWWLLERATAELTRTMGAIDGPPSFPVLPKQAGEQGRFFFAYVFLAALPHARAFHEERGVPAEVSRRTFADLGRNLAVHRWRTGEGGLGVPFWLMNHFRGKLYDLGRLQFERVRRDNGDHALSVHIPEFSGPLSPRACDASFTRAPAFFATHFEEERHDTAVCYSWLLDEQLAEYLPPDSNIVRFQQRFQDRRQEAQDDASTLEFVFGQREPDLDKLPQDTTLQRAIVTHLRAGRHWHGGSGRCHLGG